MDSSKKSRSERSSRKSPRIPFTSNSARETVLSHLGASIQPVGTAGYQIMQYLTEDERQHLKLNKELLKAINDYDVRLQSAQMRRLNGSRKTAYIQLSLQYAHSLRVGNQTTYPRSYTLSLYVEWPSTEDVISFAELKEVAEEIVQSTTIKKFLSANVRITTPNDSFMGKIPSSEKKAFLELFAHLPNSQPVMYGRTYFLEKIKTIHNSEGTQTFRVEMSAISKFFAERYAVEKL